MKKTLVVIVVLIAVAGLYIFLNKPEPYQAPERIADQSTLRSTQYGDVVGYVEPNGSKAWLGIPFARPPIGDLRWRAPLAPEAWEGERESTSFGSVCPQIGSVLSSVPAESYGKVVGSEDCLYLNIWSPTGAEDKDLPVMFWIHGGGNSIGQGGSRTYLGANLAETHQVVVVSINYRLGPLGWFSHPALQQATLSGADNSGNYGTLDIVRALEWVQGNISNFGGDKDNVTIFGESAGGANVLTMMASPYAAGLYHKAIVQSGGLFVSPVSRAQNYIDAEEPGHTFSSAEVVNRILIRDGKANDREAAKKLQSDMGSTGVRELLRAQTAEQLLSIYQGSIGGMLDAPAIFGDGDVLPTDIASSEIFADAENYNVTPVILGTNRDEVKLFMMMSGTQTKTIFGIPYGLKDEEAYDRDARYGADSWKVRGVDSIAANLKRAQDEPVFAYRFDWDEEKTVFGFDLSKALGAAHGLEIAFVFGNFDGGFGLDIYDPDGIEARDALSKSMMSYWAEFAYSGNPGKGRDGTEVHWTAWENEPSKNRLMVFDTTRDKGIRMTPDLMTLDIIKTRFLADNSYPDVTAKCAAYKQIFGRAGFDQAEYESIGNCQE